MRDDHSVAVVILATGVYQSHPSITSANEVLFLSALVSLFVSMIKSKNESTDFHKIWWKSGTWATKNR